MADIDEDPLLILITMALRSRHKNDRYSVHDLQTATESDFTVIFNELYAPLLLYACRFTENQAVAEDIVEEAFISLWNKRNSIQKFIH